MRAPWLLLLLAVGPALGVAVRALFRGRRARVIERPHPAGRTVVRYWLGSVIIAVMASVLFTMMVAFFNDASPEYYDELVIGWLLGLVLIVWRSFRMALVVTDQEIRIRNFFWSWRLPWDDVEEIFWGTPLFLRIFGGARFHYLGFRRKGDRLSVFAAASQGVRRSNWSPLDATVPRELERQAEKHRIRCGDLVGEAASAWDL